MTPILVFDIETIPDIAGLRVLSELSDAVPDHEVVAMAQQQRRERTGSDFLPHYLQQVAAISCVLRIDGEGGDKKLAVWSLGELSDGEAELIRRFYDLIERYTPQLVSWNGGGFDLPALHYRALKHCVAAPRYWDWGDEDRDFKWNNYLGRYHTRHLDLMDVLAMYQPRANAPLDAMAKLCGLPGKLGMDGSQVLAEIQKGNLEGVRNYCETDVVNTYLLYLRFQAMRGALTPAAFAAETALVRKRLGELPGGHWGEYLAAWPAG